MAFPLTNRIIVGKTLTFNLAVKKGVFSRKNNIKELTNQTIDILKTSLFDMSSIYINNITEIIGLFKSSFQVSLNLINLDLQKIAKTKEKESIDDLLNNLYNKNISTMNIFPNKYKLKLLNTLNNNNDNIFFISSFDEDINEKAEDNKEDLSEINLSIIKVMYKNFTLLSSHKLDIQLEEEKLYYL